MTNTDLTLANVLAHHGFEVVGKSDDTLTDDAREAGLIYACLGCGSIGGVEAGTPEADRVRTRDAFDFECCADNTTILF